METYSFSGKHVLVTGASGGLGQAICQELCNQGASLVMHSRSEAELKQIWAALPDTDHVTYIASDLTEPDAAGQLAKNAIQALGYIDAVFNIAGIGYFALMEEITMDAIRHVFELNTFAPLALINGLLPHMKSRGTGRIVNLVSSAGRVPIPSVGGYGGSKTAFAVMMNTMRLELQHSGIHIINIYPGTVQTDFQRHALRENMRPGLCSQEACGMPAHQIADKIVSAAQGPPGEVWLEREGKWLSAASIMWPGYVDRRLSAIRDRVISPEARRPPLEKRKWRLFQIESTIACNLKCIMCPWTGYRKNLNDKGNMTPEVWDAIRPYLSQVQSVDFTGGGEPLIQPLLETWITEAKTAGCETGFLTNGMLLTRQRARAILDAGVDWICFSMDGANAQAYNHIRVGGNFDNLYANIKEMARIRIGKTPTLMINFVIMTLNVDQLEAMIRLAKDLGVDQVNFKQCDVIRGDYGKGFGLFQSKRNREVRKVEKALSRARRLARKLNINTTAFSFSPDEQPVCDQDPRNSLFIRHDGTVSPCINLAIGGPTTFLDQEVIMPSVHYGRLPDDSIESLWQTGLCRFYRQRFQQRVDAYDRQLARSDLGEASLIKLEQALKEAAQAMPEAPDGCKVCHYLYDI